MSLCLKNGGKMRDKIVLKITMREMMLLNLCLEVTARDHARGVGLRSDIQNLQARLAQHVSQPDKGKSGI